ncbi:MAG TPA: Mur ligase family protein [Candidatus Saccharimonadales bacterium]|nr:Mur ligase family protein [Candidatus Saccharimonadales bacterium]
MIRGLLSLYWWRYPEALVYMLQSNEYQVRPYLKWYWQTTDFSQVTYRRVLEYTKAARLILWALRVGMTLQLVAGFILLALWQWKGLEGGWQFGLALILAYPLVWAHVVAIPLALGRLLVVNPRQGKAIKRSEEIFKKHPAVILAIVGSYGKTTMKELLLTVLSGGKKVVATPANKNVAISHAHFARTLEGTEEIVIIEYGEGAPGDVARFARITHPTHAIITGIAPAHLDHYKTIERAAEDILSIAQFVGKTNIYVNSESPQVARYATGKAYAPYDQHGALGWKVSNVEISLEGTNFAISHGERRIELHSGLLGRHNIGPLALAVALAAGFGMNDQQIQEGVAKTAPFEHRMQPYNLGGAWIIDDTYNGNIEGIRAGTSLLKELAATRKIYVTPGLVDQGKEAEKVHKEMGRLIAGARPDIVVLMENSATPAILDGLREARYNKEIIIEDDPLGFYVNLQAFVAAGDLVLMQNDWTDNYN